MTKQSKTNKLSTLLSEKSPCSYATCKTTIDRLKAVKDVKSCRLKK